jgi:methyl-accepting chemotaxis protein
MARFFNLGLRMWISFLGIAAVLFFICGYTFFSFIKLQNTLKKADRNIYIVQQSTKSLSEMNLERLQEIQNVVRELKEELTLTEVAVSRYVKIIIVISCIAIIATITGSLNIKAILGALKRVISSLTGSSSTLRKIIHNFEENVKLQTAKTSQIVSSVEEMNVSIADISKSVNDVLEASVSTAEVAKEGENIILKTANEIKAIDTASEKLQNTIQSLEEHSKMIENVITFIKDVAEQTNLLALNATIEAARAGEHGKSFAVVAGEIRKLAERTNKSTDEIAEVIKKIQSVVNEVKKEVEDVNKKVESGVSFSNKASQVLEEISAKSEKLQEMIQNITSEVQQISTVSSQITQDISEIADVSNKFLEGIHEISNTSEVIAKLSLNLQEEITGEVNNGLISTSLEISAGAKETEPCEFLETCPFFKKYHGNLEVIKAGWINLYCKNKAKSEECARKRFRKEKGTPPPDNMTPIGTFI